MTSILKISEQVMSIVGRGTIQEIAESVKQAYAAVAKAQWYENRNDGISEINGSFIYTFKGIDISNDTDIDTYYITIPSSYLELPHEMGLNYVGFTKGGSSPFIRMASGISGLFTNLKSNVMGNNQTYTVEGKRIYFPKMRKVEVDLGAKILLRMAISLDSVEVDEELNISPLFAGSIVDMVVAKYGQAEKKIPDTLL